MINLNKQTSYGVKKLLAMILLVAFVSPSFASADNKSEGNGHNDVRKSAEDIKKQEKGNNKEENKKAHEKKSEIKSLNKDDHDDDKNKKATTTPPIQIVKKINYFLCKTDSGWNVVTLEGERNKNSSNTMGKFCMKLPYGFAKRFNNTPATTTPDVIAPVLSGIISSGVTSSNATISWTTNESANGNVYFSTSTPLNTATASTLGNLAYSISHSFNLTGLTSSTTYYYVVKSADVSNNTATSSQYSFTTPAVLDTTTPVISGISVSGIASTTATVAWNTNELATGKLFYGTSTPLTTFVYNPTLSLAHTFNLTGLTASTTYQLSFESKDSANNTGTTTSSFVTTI